jgi:hypothetical protein
MAKGEPGRDGTMDFIEGPKARPDHPDFWRMSEIILQLDGRLEDAKTDEDRERIFLEVVREHCDVDSLMYMGVQRAMRVIKAQTGLDVIEHFETMGWLVTVYVESFIAGMEYQRRLEMAT